MRRLSILARLIPVALVACGFNTTALAWQEGAPVIPAPAAEAAVNEAAPQLSEEERLQMVMNLAVDQVHADLFQCDPFPSAKKCAGCHPQHFREWSISPHSYAQLSPIFNAMSSKLQAATSGTQGDFCIRCHTPVGISIGEPANMSNLDRHPSSREGVTCVVCHRVNQSWGKGSGRLALVRGDINQAVYGPLGSEVLAEVLSSPSEYGVLKTSPHDGVGEKSREIHGNAIRFFQMGTSSFCGACHDVFAPNGFRLEDAFSEFKSSPAALEQGLSCQDCHMGHTPGKAEGYTCGPAAIVGGKPTRFRRVTNHMMAGPDHSIIHRGLYPHHLTAIREEGDTTTPEAEGLATMREWLQFNDYGGWGTEQYEAPLSAEDNKSFPVAWQNPTKRKKARLILNEQAQVIRESTVQRLAVLRAGFFVGDIEIEEANRSGLSFKVPVKSITTGHGVPTGFDAERVIFLRTAVFNAEGRPVFVSGDLDPNGDIRDSHSAYVHDGKVPLDRQIFTLQTRFITRNIRGGEREQVLPVPFLLDPLPFVRPETRPFTVLGRPGAARKQKQNIEPRGYRDAHYHVGRSQLCGPGPFTIRTQLISGMVPPNLIHAIEDVGFDYCMSGKQIADQVVRGHLVLYDRSTCVNVD